MVTSNEYNMLH